MRQLVALLLRLYPASFRREYGPELVRLVSQRRREVGGPLAVASFWVQESVDLLVSAAQIHADALRQDLRFGARALARQPGSAVAALLVTALGVGANTAVFSLADRVLVRPLPFPEPERLVKLWERLPEYSRMELSPANYRDWKAAASAFESMAAYSTQALNLVGEGEPARVEAVVVGAELLPMLGTRPVLGRLFTSQDVEPEAPATAILGWSLWQSHFGGRRDVVGRRVRLDDVSFAVIGVLPPEFSFPSRTAQLWLPLSLAPASFEDRNNNYLQVVARLRPKVSLDEARAELEEVTRRLEREHPDTNENARANVVALRDEISSQSRMLLAALVGASACLLLLACSNLASLLLARAGRRRRELAVRSALGAGRDRLVRQMLTESLILALAGGALGVLFAVAAAPLLDRLLPATLPVAGVTALDGRVLGFALLVTLLTGLGFGLVPALRSADVRSADALRSGARSGLGGGSEHLRAALVTAEVAAALALVIAAGLLIRALWRVQAVDPGFRTANVLSLQTPLPTERYAAAADRTRFYGRVVAGVESLPGVERAAYISFLPMTLRGGIWPVAAHGEEPSPTRSSQTASLRFVTPGFFDALGIPVLRGRDVAATDGPERPSVAVVSASFAERHWPGQDPLGRRFFMAFAERTVIGVVGDVRVRGLERASEPQVYLADRQAADGSLTFYRPRDLVIRASTDPTALVPAVRRIVGAADPELPLTDVRRLDDLLAAETAPRRLQLHVLGSFAVVALLLAAIGIHGLLACAVGERVSEIGVRVAVGATPGRILRLVVGDAMRLGLRGALIGLALAYAAGRWMQALLAGVAPTDAPAYLLGAGVALLAVLTGCLVPALRALRVDPTTALREP